MSNVSMRAQEFLLVERFLEDTERNIGKLNPIIKKVLREFAIIAQEVYCEGYRIGYEEGKKDGESTQETANGKCTPFGKTVKKRLIDLGQSQAWLMSQVTEKTGLFVDSGYLSKILTGKRQAPKIVQAIMEILNIKEES